ncbi:MAG: hypothetical protein IPK03_03020 [Bacteroidetes bacterium]|nr:hypothetical protein [Bacteroidota bacterium]
MPKKMRSFILVMLFSSQILIAQDEKSNEIEQMKIQLQKSDDARKARIDEYVAKFNFPRSGYTENGNYFFIHHIDEKGIPVYYETKGNQGDSVLKLYSIVNSASNESAVITAIQTIALKKNRTLKFESAQSIASIIIINDKGKVQLSNQAISKNSFELKMSKWLDGNYSAIVKLKNNQIYFTHFKL